MAINDDRSSKDASRLATLGDDEVTTTRVNRRSFLGRTVGAGTVAIGAALTTACTDHCDADTVTDRDGGLYADPPHRPRDRTCDKDGWY